MEKKNIEFESPDKKKILEIKNDLMKELTEKRYEHTIGVAYTASSMAMRYGENVTKALLAGLLHDCAKCISDDKKIAKCEKNGIAISNFEMKNPYLLHAKLGAWKAKNEYGIEDDDIYNSILYHTTGYKNLSLLCKIIFISDYIEPGRKQIDGLNEIRYAAFNDIDKCMGMILKSTIDYLNSKNIEGMDENTLIAYDYYKQYLK